MTLRLSSSGAAEEETLSPTQPRRRRSAPLVLGALLLVTLAGLTACTADRHNTTAVAGGIGGEDLRRQAEPVWLDYTRCARQNGYPDLSDPIIDASGRAEYEGTSKQQRLKMKQDSHLLLTCGHVLDRLPGSAQRQGEAPPAPAEMQQLVRFAECMRDNGLPDWPDPRADGTFNPPGNRLEREPGYKARMFRAAEACRRHNPDPKGNLPLTNSVK